MSSYLLPSLSSTAHHTSRISKPYFPLASADSPTINWLTSTCFSQSPNQISITFQFPHLLCIDQSQLLPLLTTNTHAQRSYPYIMRFTSGGFQRFCPASSPPTPCHCSWHTSLYLCGTWHSSSVWCLFPSSNASCPSVTTEMKCYSQERGSWYIQKDERWRHTGKEAIETIK